MHLDRHGCKLKLDLFAEACNCVVVIKFCYFYSKDNRGQMIYKDILCFCLQICVNVTDKIMLINFIWALNYKEEECKIIFFFSDWQAQPQWLKTVILKQLQTHVTTTQVFSVIL